MSVYHGETNKSNDQHIILYKWIYRGILCQDNFSYQWKYSSKQNYNGVCCKQYMSLDLYRSKLCKILFLDSFEYLICMDLAFMNETQKVKSYNNKIISAYFFCLLRAYHISSWYQHIFMGRISPVMLLCPIAIFV